MEKQKTKLGARILSKEELNAILPNAESIYEQIGVFRDSIPENNHGHSIKTYEIEQKTNNIGIMGCRGAGKTSVLKTFFHKLCTKNEDDNKDIILPIIIPENMSSGTTLMDVILGRLKSIVEEQKRTEEDEKYSQDCIYSGRNLLEQKYNELVKQYCYIKKDYRDILIQQFTTEQNYVDKTKEVFSSDAEFLRLFNEFMISLLTNGRNADRNSMLFLFIDDIDLSANRCMDIVRTLLVYLSNPRIVTFISGDIETFEEELTLEFLRQEEALKEGVFQESFYESSKYSDGGRLIERKKTLSYEYLKKIIPPVYRRTIRYWGLEQRGSYQVTEDGGGEQKSLAELLVEATKGKLKKQYFIYREDDVQKCMGLVFHMFDDTSRGLNNVYNVLREICDLQKKEEQLTEENQILLFWRLVETIVDSKPLYTKYKSELMRQIIVLGQGQVTVNFSNAYQFLFSEGSPKSKERFALYMLIDFASKLFAKEQQEVKDDEKYFELRRKIIQEYISDETIDEKISTRQRLLACLESGYENKDTTNDSAEWILINLLRNSDFILALHLIRILQREQIYKILERKNKKSSDKKDAYKIAYALFRAVKAINESEEEIQEYIADLYVQMQDTMQSLLNKLSLNPWMIYGNQLIDMVSGNGGKRFMNGKGDLAEASFWNAENYIHEGRGSVIQNENLLWAEYENQNAGYWIYFEQKLRERKDKRMEFDIKDKAQKIISLGLIKTITNQMHKQGIMDQYEVKELKKVSYSDLLKGKGDKEKKEIQVIEQIDEQSAWTSDYAKEKIFPYLKRKETDTIIAMSRGRAIFDATQMIRGAFFELERCYKGSSGKALVYGVKEKVRQAMFLEGKPENYEEYYLRLEQVLIIQCLLEEFLNFHGRAVYGKKEVRKLLMEMKELPLVLHSSEWKKADEELQKKEEVLFNSLEMNQTIGEDEKDRIDKICRIWYGSCQTEGELRKFINQYLGDFGENRYITFRQMLQKREIEILKDSQDNVKDWSDMEQDFSETDYIFWFHCYLRYLQANDDEVKKAGAQADDIVKLAEYMLDGEIKADERIQNEVYQLINEKIGMTEEEFESLF